jgi:hypothetical protein
MCQKLYVICFKLYLIVKVMVIVGDSDYGCESSETFPIFFDGPMYSKIGMDIPGPCQPPGG